MNSKLSLTFHQLQHFLAIAEHGSLRAASQRLGLSQPAVSKSLRALESVLGTSLIHRTPRGVSLTPAGELFLARARLIDNEIHRTTEEIQSLAGGGGQVVIGASAIPSILLLPKAVAGFSRQHPGVSLDIIGGMPGLLLSKLMDGALDFVVGPKPRNAIPESIRSSLLLRLDVNLVVRKGHPLAHARRLEEFADAQWVISSNSSYAKAALSSFFDKGAKTNAPPYIRVDSLFALLSFIRSTDLVGLVPGIDESMSLYGHDISVLKIEGIDMQEEYQLFTRRNHEPSQVSAGLIAAIYKEARLYSQGDSDVGKR